MFTAIKDWKPLKGNDSSKFIDIQHNYTSINYKYCLALNSNFDKS